MRNYWKGLIQQQIVPGSRGLEIGPFCNPLAPRSLGFNTIIVDILGRSGLQELAANKAMPEAAIAAIEEVDVVGDASRLGELLHSHGLAGPLNWIISSHNFEHLPNPLRFLQDCESLLGDDGLLMMVIPDQRYIFDRFHPHTTTAQVLRAAVQIHDASSDAWAMFEQASLRARLQSPDGQLRPAWNPSLHEDRALVMADPLSLHHGRLQKLLAAEDFSFSGHRWHLTPAVFELLLFDLAQLQLIGLGPLQIQPTRMSDFFVVLQRGSHPPLSDGEAAEHRLALCSRIENERAAASSLCQEQARRLEAQEQELEELRRRLAEAGLDGSPQG